MISNRFLFEATYFISSRFLCEATGLDTVAVYILRRCFMPCQRNFCDVMLKFVNLSSFQKPSRYINREINALYKDAPVKVALAFPDVYEIGMSHLGLKILYKIINDLPYASAERVFSPWIDFEAELKNRGLPLCSLESNRPLKDFDIVGFSLQYELAYTTALNMLSLGGIPLKSIERENLSACHYPLIIAGGPCTVNPLPMSSFIDAFLIGDGEDAIKEILDIFYRWKSEGDNKKESLLSALSGIEGLYVPAVHNNFILSPYNNKEKEWPVIKRRYIKSLDYAPYPDNPIVPYTAIIHDRINVEVARGCSMGCRFCQAGMIYRPVRERNPEKALQIAEASLKHTGYEEVSFTSLSAGDYSCLIHLVKEFNSKFSDNKIALSLPSLRVASVNKEVLKEIRTVRKTGFTIAPEAATDRLRRVINKNFSEEDYENALRTLFEEGWLNLKLYFMIGLPTETEEDIGAIPEMVMKAMRIAKKITRKFVNINVGISSFVPKAHTPFQWFGQNPADELRRKKQFIKDSLIKKGINIKSHDVKMSLLEAAFSRGDRKLSVFLEKAWSLGCRLDSWSEVFDFDKWKQAMDRTGIDISEYSLKNYEFSDILPWENIDIGVSKEFLRMEYQKAISGSITADCRKVCHNCGIGCTKDSKTSIQILNNKGHKPFSLKERQFKPVRIRVRFSKTGNLRYLSHREIVTLIHRTIRKAGFPIEYSKGYHPAPRISFGPPLGVGVSGLNEYFDMEIVPPFDLDINRKTINSLLPDGICVKDMSVIPADTESLTSFISRYEYEIKGGDHFSMLRFMSEKEVFVEREEEKFVNLKDMVEEIQAIDKDAARMILVDQANTKVRLWEILPVILNMPIENLHITRIGLYGWKDGWVKPFMREAMQSVALRS